MNVFLKIKVAAVLFSIPIMLYSCKEDDMVIDQTIEISIVDEDGNLMDSAQADGASILYLKATIPAEADETIREVTFNKSDGDFLGVSTATVTRPLDDNNTAQIPVRVPKKVNPLFFSATIAYESVNFVDEAQIVLSRAYADDLVVEPSSVMIPIASAITINVFMTRSNGIVSEGTPAYFRAFQMLDNASIDVGRFTGLVNAATNENGEIMVSYLTDTNDINTDEPVLIEVSTVNDAGETISSTFQLTINP
jgi:hypothetical protein